MNAKISHHVLAIFICCPGPADAGEMRECIESLQRRAELFFASESVHIGCSEENLQHLLITPEEDNNLQSLIRSGDAQDAVSRFSMQSIMRTPGYTYEFALRNNRIYQKVANRNDAKYGEDGVTGVFDGTFGIALHGVEHAFVESTPPADSWQKWEYGNLLNLNYFRGLDQYELRDLFPAAMRPVFLPEDLQGADPPFELEGTAILDDVECVLLSQPGKWRWWLDPTRGWVPLRREQFVTRPDGNIALSHTASMADLREEKKGLWLPRTIIQEQYVTSAQARTDGPGQIKPAIRWTLTINQIEFDSLTDSFFEPELPRGILVHDNIRKLDYVADNLSGIPFSKAIQTAADRMGYRPQSNPLRVLAVVGGIGTLILLLLASSGYRKKKRT